MLVPRVFLSYSHMDRIWLERLRKHLAVLEKQGCLDVWTDQRIVAGSLWQEMISGAIDSAQVAVMIISADFLQSNFVLQEEVPRILERRAAGKLQVVPVLACHCPWEVVPWLAELQIRPLGAVPLTAHRGHRLDNALKTIALEIERLAARAD